MDAISVALIIDGDVRDDGVVANLETPGEGGRFEKVIGGIEEGSDVTTLATSAAIVAGCAAIVLLGEDGAAAVSDVDANAFARFAQKLLTATGCRRRQVIL